MKVYEIELAESDAKDRFLIAAESFEDAVEQAKNRSLLARICHASIASIVELGALREEAE
jgi:hypothetical protein